MTYRCTPAALVATAVVYNYINEATFWDTSFTIIERPRYDRVRFHFYSTQSQIWATSLVIKTVGSHRRGHCMRSVLRPAKYIRLPSFTQPAYLCSSSSGFHCSAHPDLGRGYPGALYAG